MKRILVTGAAGFLGSSLSIELLKKGHIVLGIDNFNSDLYPKMFKQSNWDELTRFPNFLAIISDFSEVTPAQIGKIDLCYNFAALPGLISGLNATEKYFETNVLGTEKFLQTLTQQQNLRLIHASTSSVYGAEAIGDENENCYPISSYGISKLATEHVVRNYCEKMNVSYSILRFFSVYGPRQRPDMAIHKLITCALGGKTFEVYGGLDSTRSNTFVSDAIDALITFGEASDLFGIYNIAGGEKKSLSEWIISVENLIGKKIELNFIPARDGDQRLTSGNTSHARQAMGFAPKVESSEGLKLQLTHILKNSNLYINS